MIAIRERGLASLRGASECALLGAVFVLFSLPVVTAGAAWSAAATVCTAWSRGEQPPLFRTFARVARCDLVVGTALAACGLAAGAAAYLDVRVALAGGMPGARPAAAVIALVGAAFVAVVLLAFPHRAATGDGFRASLVASTRLAGRSPRVVPSALAALAAGVAIVDAFPAIVVVAAGPVAFAVTAVYTHATRRLLGDREA